MIEIALTAFVIAPVFYVIGAVMAKGGHADEVAEKQDHILALEAECDQLDREARDARRVAFNEAAEHYEQNTKVLQIQNSELLKRAIEFANTEIPPMIVSVPADAHARCADSRNVLLSRIDRLKSIAASQKSVKSGRIVAVLNGDA